MSFSDAIGQVDQIVQWEQQLANPSALNQSTSTSTSGTGTTATTSSSDSSNSSSFTDALAQAQAQEGTSALSVLDPSDSTDPSTSTAASSSSSDLLSGGDSQLLSALQAASSGSSSPADADADASTDADAGTSSTATSSELSALEAALGGSSSDGTTSDTTSSSVLTALEQALQSSGSTSATGSAASDLSAASATTGTAATSASDPRIQSMLQEANGLLGKPYVWGGGHDNFGPQSGYDCSGFVSAVLHAGGYLSSPQDTETLPTAAGIESGPGQYVTIYDRTTPGQEGHVIMSIDGQFYESGGQSGTWGGGGGVEQISTPSASYLSTFNQILHPEGL
jgi:cell wall-associated NlpC family hydrolase